MSLHVIVGAGPVGSAVARELLQRGEQVRVITRSGSGIEGVEKVACDAGDAAALTTAAAGADVIYNCVNPPYDKWTQLWPPVADALLIAAEKTGAVLAVTSNLYVYGPVDAPMTEDLPLAATGSKGRVRAKMWHDALAAHEQGRIRMFEVRGSDYLGGNSLLSMMIGPALRKGRTARVPAAVDVPHSFTDVRDVASLLIAGATDERAWGRAWHVPSNAPITIRQLTEIAAGELRAQPKVSPLPYAVLWTAGVFNPVIRELRETQHQFRHPWVLDSTAATDTFGLKPHDLADSVAFDLANATDAAAAA